MLEATLSPALTPIILADDEGLYLLAVTRGLEQRGHHVVPCSDLEGAEAAFRRLQAEGCRPALVVDLIQPGDNSSHLGGLDLLRRLGPLEGCPVVAVMDSDAAWLEQAARSLGATRVVRKPDLRHFAPEHLDRALSRYTGQIAGEPAGDEPVMQAAGSPASDDTSASAAPDLQGREAALILGAVEEMRHVQDRVGVLLLLMRLAAELAARGMLLEVAGDHLRVLGCFGATCAAAGDRLPLDRDSLPARAFWSARVQRARQGAVGDLPLGMDRTATGEAMALPILGPDGVVGVLYADAGAAGGVLPDLRPMMTLAGTARLALASIPAGRS